MGLFPDKDKMKVVMKNGLPLIFAVAWTPVLWMVLAVVFGSAMEHLLGSWQAAIGLLGVSALLLMAALSLLFRRYGLGIFDATRDA
ncbi:MAG: hypothetical protein HGB02_06355 [Chlorobiaceae bacterium]|nr:hypothetical protein [Chlorobiaceae bacterium]